MTAARLSTHVVVDGETLDRIVERHRLSSSRALTDIAANQPLGQVLQKGGALPQGLLLYIPPRAGLLIRERIYLLASLRPQAVRYFDDMRAVVNGDLRTAVERATDAASDAAVAELLGRLHDSTREKTASLARNAAQLVDISRAFLLTHVAERTDHAVANAAADPMCPLYWLVTPPILEFWVAFWAPGSWRDKWSGLSPSQAIALVDRQLNTLSSVVVQQFDWRLRDARQIENRLLGE